ncbi:valine--trna ligase, partial [Quercus suber]
VLSEKNQEIEDEKKKKKKIEKAREKKLKKQKALEKAAKLQAQQTSTTRKRSEKKMVKRGGKEETSEDFLDPETPFGKKKRLSSQMAKQYSPTAVEKSWYAWWEKSGFFVADAKSCKPPFVIVLPPPNVTGALHIGHALTAAVELLWFPKILCLCYTSSIFLDTIIRWRRMSGYNTLWVPGMDHAGIATQCFTMDEKRSRAVTEAFVRLYKEKLVYSFSITSFTRRDERLVNWDYVLRTAISDIEVEHIEIKERTLLNVPGYEKPVEFGVLTSFAYPLEGELGEIVVATTRVETMLGDTAIAIHPDDPRYNHLRGKFAIHPFNGRKLPIVCDATLVDPKFGTGAVKITPAHDLNDFEFKERHNCESNIIESINIFTDDRKINSNGGSEFAGMPRFKAREAVIESLQKKVLVLHYCVYKDEVPCVSEQTLFNALLFVSESIFDKFSVYNGLYRGAKGNEMRLGICSRTNDVVEPLSKPQWYVKCNSMARQALTNDVVEPLSKPQCYVKCNSMARQALDAIEDKKIEIIPKQYAADWKRWLENIRDWCVLRQLWWGHRVDDELKELGAYNDRDHWVVARNEDEAQEEANPDVLDTWFSSGLFPLTVLGWPDDTEDLKAFYPTSVLETGHDILFFWVVRMVMLGMKLGGYLHPMIRDAHGHKMSKSLGNVIDPLEVINGISLEGLHKRLEEGNLDPKELTVAKEGQVKDFPNGIPECGTDALRFALISYTAQSDKINLDIQRVVGYRQWCNKLWNAVRFAISKFGNDYVPPANVNPDKLPFSCQWILSLLSKAISKTITALELYELSDAASTVYSWWQYQLCDVFIEAIKPFFAGNDPEFESVRSSARDTLWLCLDNGL